MPFLTPPLPPPQRKRRSWIVPNAVRFWALDQYVLPKNQISEAKSKKQVYFNFLQHKEWVLYIENQIFQFHCEFIYQ